jgi:hypothetical protein
MLKTFSELAARLQDIGGIERQSKRLRRENIETCRKVAERLVVDRAIQWWISNRPASFGREEHIANPTVNCRSDAAKFLAQAIAEFLAAGDAVREIEGKR